LCYLVLAVLLGKRFSIQRYAVLTVIFTKFFIALLGAFHIIYLLLGWKCQVIAAKRLDNTLILIMLGVGAITYYLIGATDIESLFLGYSVFLLVPYLYGLAMDQESLITVLVSIIWLSRSILLLFLASFIKRRIDLFVPDKSRHRTKQR
jgi:hypothetical protein